MNRLPTITPSQAKSKLENDDFIILDVREPDEYQFTHIDNSVHIPMMSVPQNLAKIPKEKDIGVLCHHGSRSARVTMYLLQYGYYAFNIDGGIDRWAMEADREHIKRYNRMMGRISGI